MAVHASVRVTEACVCRLRVKKNRHATPSAIGRRTSTEHRREFMNALHSTLGLAFVTAIALLPSTAGAWWACPSGMTMELRNNNTQVRCFSPTQYRDHDACPLVTAAGVTVGTVIRRDWDGNHDRCVGFVGGNAVTSVSPTCNSGGPGFTLQRRSNPHPDRCSKSSRQAAPSVKR